jgi:hypothetical protein
MDKIAEKLLRMAGDIVSKKGKSKRKKKPLSQKDRNKIPKEPKKQRSDLWTPANQVHKTQKDYTRKQKHKKDWE